MDKHTIIGLAVILGFVAIWIVVMANYPKFAAAVGIWLLFMMFCNSNSKGN